MLTLQQTIEYLKSNCMKHVHGNCSTRRCFRLGENEIHKFGTRATCEYDMAVHYLELQEKARSSK